MNPRLTLRWIHACAALLISAAGTSVSQASAPDDRSITFSIGGDWTYIRVIRMTETDGAKPRYDGYRMSSRRSQIRASANFDWGRISLVTGLADLETHSSEGEVTRFDANPLIGLRVEGAWHPHSSDRFSIQYSSGFLQYNFDGAKTAYTAKHEYSTGGNPSGRWTEWDACISGVVHHGQTQWESGLHLVRIDASQKRVFPEQSIRSSFDPDYPASLFLGTRHSVTPRLDIHMRATFVKTTAWQFGATWSL